MEETACPPLPERRDGMMRSLGIRLPSSPKSNTYPIPSGPPNSYSNSSRLPRPLASFSAKRNVTAAPLISTDKGRGRSVSLPMSTFRRGSRKTSDDGSCDGDGELGGGVEVYSPTQTSPMPVGFHLPGYAPGIQTDVPHHYRHLTYKAGQPVPASALSTTTLPPPPKSPPPLAVAHDPLPLQLPEGAAPAMVFPMPRPRPTGIPHPDRKDSLGALPPPASRSIGVGVLQIPQPLIRSRSRSVSTPYTPSPRRRSQTVCSVGPAGSPAQFQDGPIAEAAAKQVDPAHRLATDDAQEQLADDEYKPPEPRLPGKGRRRAKPDGVRVRSPLGTYDKPPTSPTLTSPTSSTKSGLGSIPKPASPLEMVRVPSFSSVMLPTMQTPPSRIPTPSRPLRLPMAELVNIRNTPPQQVQAQPQTHKRDKSEGYRSWHDEHDVDVANAPPKLQSVPEPAIQPQLQDDEQAVLSVPSVPAIDKSLPATPYASDHEASEAEPEPDTEPEGSRMPSTDGMERKRSSAILANLALQCDALSADTCNRLSSDQQNTNTLLTDAHDVRGDVDRVLSGSAGRPDEPKESADIHEAVAEPANEWVDESRFSHPFLHDLDGSGAFLTTPEKKRWTRNEYETSLAYLCDPTPDHGEMVGDSESQLLPRHSSPEGSESGNGFKIVYQFPSPPTTTLDLFVPQPHAEQVHAPEETLPRPFETTWGLHRSVTPEQRGSLIDPLDAVPDLDFDDAPDIRRQGDSWHAIPTLPWDPYLSFISRSQRPPREAGRSHSFCDAARPPLSPSLLSPAPRSAPPLSSPLLHTTIWSEVPMASPESLSPRKDHCRTHSSGTFLSLESVYSQPSNASHSVMMPSEYSNDYVNDGRRYSYKHEDTSRTSWATLDELTHELIAQPHGLTITTIPEVEDEAHGNDGPFSPLPPSLQPLDTLQSHLFPLCPLDLPPVPRGDYHYSAPRPTSVPYTPDTPTTSHWMNPARRLPADVPSPVTPQLSPTFQARRALYDLPAEIMIKIFRHLPIDAIETFVSAFPRDSDWSYHFAMISIKAVFERTWEAGTPSSVWRHHLLACSDMGIPASAIHTPRHCLDKKGKLRKYGHTHEHEMALSLRDARRLWHQTDPNTITVTPKSFEFKNCGKTHRFSDTLDEHHLCRQHHVDEIDFVCTTLIRLYREASRDHSPEVYDHIESLVACKPFEEMCRIMYCLQPPHEFVRTLELLSYLQSLHMTSVPQPLPRLKHCEALLPVPQINLDGTVAWYDVWSNVRVLVPLARRAIEAGDSFGGIHSALLTSPPSSVPHPRAPDWDWACIYGDWQIAIVEYPAAQDTAHTPRLAPLGHTRLIPCTPADLAAALRQYTRPRSELNQYRDDDEFATSSLSTGLPWSEALAPLYFHGVTRPAVSQARYYLRGVVRLTRNKPSELRYKVIFRNTETRADELCFEGIQVGGCGSGRGAMGVAFPDHAQKAPGPWTMPRDLVARMNAATEPITLVPPLAVPEVYPCWFWKPDGGSEAGAEAEDEAEVDV